MAGTLSRRSLLRAGATGAAAVAATGLIGGAAEAGATGRPAAAVPLAFHGQHQAGVLRPATAFATYVAFDVLAADRAELQALLQTVTARTRLLSAGGTLSGDGATSTPADSLVLGPEAPAGGFSATLGLGASLFDDRYGLAAMAPKRLKAMPTFPNDALDPALCHGDIGLLFQADAADVVHHAVRDVTRHTRGAMQPRWTVGATSSPSRPDGAPRNPLGFKDGSANPSADDRTLMDGLVWVGAGDEPAWAVGGTYQVTRRIRMLVEFWDRVSLNEQEKMFGRRKATGAPLGGKVETDEPRYDDDPQGTVIPLDAHIRMANPRTPETDPSRIVRRSFTYDRGLDTNGQLDVGILFTAYQQDVERQFEAVQRRLVDEPLVDYVSPVGGGYFFVPPAVRGPDDHFASGLFT